MPTYKRSLIPLIYDAMQNTPAIFINGPRQAGKTTLVKEIAQNLTNAEYLTFDDITLYSAALADPRNFLRTSISKSPVIIDEVQMVPQLFRELKMNIDELRFAQGNSANGKYILTGSANIMVLPEIAAALVGRVYVFTLYQLSVSEVLNQSPNFINFLYAKSINEFNLTTAAYSLEDMICKATFPEIASNPNINIYNWFSSYITTLLQRDIQSITQIEKISALPNMLNILAGRAGGLINESSLASDIGLNPVTFKRYRMLLEALFLTLNIKPWFRNIGKRFVKSAKLYFSDTLLLCYLLGVDIYKLREKDSNLFGKVIENFVASELSKLLTLRTNLNLFHFRMHDDKEIDFLLESFDGKIAAIEVKARSYVISKDFKAIRDFASLVGDDFVKGIVLYCGDKIVPFADNLFAVPIQMLWS